MITITFCGTTVRSYKFALVTTDTELTSIDSWMAYSETVNTTDVPNYLRVSVFERDVV